MRKVFLFVDQDVREVVEGCAVWGRPGDSAAPDSRTIVRLRNSPPCIRRGAETRADRELIAACLWRRLLHSPELYASESPHGALMLPNCFCPPPPNVDPPFTNRISRA